MKLEDLKADVPLAPYTTFKIGGPVKLFCEVFAPEQLVKAVRLALAEKISFFILGGGSNVLVSDQGFGGLVIRFSDPKTEIRGTKITVSAGASLPGLVRASAEAGLAGTEWAAGIPGTVGGAICGNSGSFGKSMSEITESVTAIRLSDGQVISLRKDDLKKNTEYRQSYFAGGGHIILEAKLRLKKGSKEEIGEKIRQYFGQREKTQPLGLPSAGCIFKNPRLADYDLQITEGCPEMGGFAAKGTVPAGWLIEKCGLKGKGAGGAKISEKHANFIVNSGNAKAEDVVALIGLARQKVSEKFGIALEEEIQRLGF